MCAIPLKITSFLLAMIYKFKPDGPQLYKLSKTVNVNFPQLYKISQSSRWKISIPERNKAAPIEKQGSCFSSY